MHKRPIQRGLILGPQVNAVLGGRIPTEDVTLVEVDGGRVSAPRDIDGNGELPHLAISGLLVRDIETLGDDLPGSRFLLADRGFQIRQLGQMEKLDSLRHLLSPLVSSEGRIKQMGLPGRAHFTKLKHVSFAFEDAFTRFDRLSLPAQIHLEQDIPQKTSAKVAIDAFKHLMTSIGLPDVRVTEEMRSSLALDGISFVKKGDVDGGSHSHSEPHWYVALKLIRNMIVTSDRSTKERIDEAVKKRGITQSGGLIFEAIIARSADSEGKKVG